MTTTMVPQIVDGAVARSKPKVLSVSETSIYKGARVFIAICAILKCCQRAYSIRMGAIDNFGTVIHEFDVRLLYNSLHCSCHTLTLQNCLLKAIFQLSSDRISVREWSRKVLYMV